MSALLGSVTVSPSCRCRPGRASLRRRSPGHWRWISASDSPTTSCPSFRCYGEFHKVHHSAEVLTPLTAGRVHPLDDAISFLLAGVMGASHFSLCRSLLGSNAVMFGVFQLNVLVVIFYFAGFHLRHSHVWLPYKGIWGKLFVSPAHHQVHHSVAQRHWDKSLGFVFAMWDSLFG